MDRFPKDKTDCSIGCKTLDRSVYKQYEDFCTGIRCQRPEVQRIVIIATINHRLRDVKPLTINSELRVL